MPTTSRRFSPAPPRDTRPAARPPDPRRARCQNCEGLVMACRDASGAVVAVDPTPIFGGDLLINAALDVIVMRLSQREAVAAARRHELGFVLHARVCLPANRTR